MTNSDPPVEERKSWWRRLHKAVVAIAPWSILLAVLALFLSVIQFWMEYEDRVNERVVRAWQLVTTAAPGNSGKRAALEYLNKEDGLLCFDWLQGDLEWLYGEENRDTRCIILMKPRTPLLGIDLSPPNIGQSTNPEKPIGAYLHETDLSGANLSNANLRFANLSHADLRDADLRNANLSGAILHFADLRGADLRSAILPDTDLRHAKFSGALLMDIDLRDADLFMAVLNGTTMTRADLTEAHLQGVDLRGADLTGATLSQSQLDMQNCGDEHTKVPSWLEIRKCSE